MKWLASDPRRDDAGDGDPGDAPPLADIDEELPEPAGRPGGTSQRRALAGGAVVLVAVALTARAVTGHDSGRPVAGGSPSPSVTSSAADPKPVLRDPPRISAPPVRPLPPQFRPAGCPADADACAITYGLPDAAMEALRRAFPGAVLSEAVSLLAERAGRFGPDLVSRAFRARIGSTDVSVYISKPTTTQAVSASDRQYGHITTTTSLRQTVPGFVVSVDVGQPARNLPVAFDYLVQLANDDGLLAPQ